MRCVALTHIQSFSRQKFTPLHNSGIIGKVTLVLVALKEMSPFAMINVSAFPLATNAIYTGSPHKNTDTYMHAPGENASFISAVLRLYY
jgi:hypothetical protein